MKRPLKTTLELLIYVGATLGLYYLICLAMHRPFEELHLLYALLIGCVAYLPRFINQRKAGKRSRKR